MCPPEALADLREEVLRCRVYELGDRAGWVDDLVNWANSHPELVPAHRKAYRSWHRAGRRLLVIQRTRGGLRIVAGVDYTKPDPQLGQVASFVIALSGPLTAAELEAVKNRVELGIENMRAEPGMAGQDPGEPEHRMQAAMIRHAECLGWPRGLPLRREFPVVRPGGGTGFIDLLRLDAKGRLHIIETKIGHDEMLIFQGLDYWMWVEENKEALARELGAKIRDVVIDYVIGAAPDVHPGWELLSPYALSHLRALRPEVAWQVHALTGWETGPGRLSVIGSSKNVGG